ncbi:MAG: glycosyltransferase family 2 protein [Actinomycetota bacterium]
MSDAPVVSVVFPCLNEGPSIADCVTRARKAFDAAGIPCEVVVVDNGSTDDSSAEAERAGARIVFEKRRGYGAAMVAGVAAARGEIILNSDADGTYPLEDGPVLARAALDSGAIVLGSRFAGRIMPGAMPVLHRLVGSPATRLLLRVLCGIRSSDPHSGMRAMRRSVFEAVKPISRGWEFTVEQLLNAHRRGVAVQEIPIDYFERVGTSKLRALPQGWGFFRFMILHSPTFLFTVPGVLAMLLGVGMLAWLASGDRMVGSLEFGVNSLVVAAMATIVGYQIVALGACARVYISSREPDGLSRRGFERWFTLERGIVVGLLLAIAGLALIVTVGLRWLVIDFGVLPRSDHGLAIVGLTTAVVGMQTIFSSFFLSLVEEVEAPPAAS